MVKVEQVSPSNSKDNLPMSTSEYANEQNKKELDGDNTDSFPLNDVQDKNESNETEQAITCIAERVKKRVSAKQILTETEINCSIKRSNRGVCDMNE